MPTWKITNRVLNCIPALPEHVSLPWDAADELLVNLNSHLPMETTLPSLIIGDRYGALSTAHPSTLLYSDNMSAALAINQNRLTNNLPATQVEHNLETAFQSLALKQKDNNTNNRLVIARFPKQFEVLTQYIYLCSQYDCTIILSGMHKHLPIRWLNWLEGNSTSYRQSRIIRKARVVAVQPNKNVTPPKLTSYQIDHMKLTAEPGVYGRDLPDPGAMALLPHLPHDRQGRIADLGCGNGILSIATKLRCPQADVVGIDDSYVAIKSATDNGLMAKQSIHWIHSDVFHRVDGVFDFIICNPPFHDGHKLSQNIATDMFHQSAKILKKGGELLVVANRHLPYLKILKRLFKVSSLSSSDHRFSIYLCRK